MTREDDRSRRLADIAAAAGITPTEAERRKAYLELTDADAAVLQALREPLRRAHQRVVEAFYAHLERFPETRRLMSDPATVRRLKEKQAQYFDAIIAGEYDWRYVEDRLAVGLTHHEVGLEPRWYIGAYNKYLTELIPEVWGMAGSPAEALRAVNALIKVVMFDLELALEAYHQADRAAVVSLKEYAESIVCSVPAGLVVLSGELKVVSANRLFGEVAGAPHGELPGRELEAVLPGAGLGDRAREVLASYTPQSGIAYHRASPDGETAYYEITITPLRHADSGEAAVAEASLLIVVEDLTHQQHLQRLTREADERVRALMDSVAEGIITIDETGTVESFNAAAEQLFGYSSSEVVGDNVKRLMPDPDHRNHDGYLQGYARSGQRRCLGVGFREVVGRRKDGSRFPMELSISEMQLEGRIRYIGVMRDISERKRSDMQMAKLTRAVEQAADSILITDKNGVIEYVNAGFEEVTGYSREEALGQTPRLVKSGTHDHEFYKRLWGTVLAGDVFREVFVNRRRNGALYYEEKTITPLRDESGNITHFISAGKDITERMRSQERLQYLAHHDPLTDLPNRVLFADRLERAIARAHRFGGMAAVLFMDLDHFKRINDTLGHATGDKLLQRLSERLSQVVRETDTVARLGGDEFALLLEQLVDVDDVAHVARKILAGLERAFVIDGREFFVTTSIGISLYPDDGGDVETLLKHGDVAMYRAKEAGRSTYQFYHRDMNAQAYERLALETSLQGALDRSEFFLCYQPQVDLATGRTVGAEALIRWRHPEKGLVAPKTFMAVLEETGQVVHIGEWVLREACQACKAWNLQEDFPVRVAVNLSSRQFNAPGLVETVAEVLEAHALPAHLLELEITEETAMHNVDQTRQVMEALTDMGVQLAIDDFGTGYSSLSHLKRFPIDTLKIDQSFVRDLVAEPDDAAIAETIIRMGHSLGMRVVAEGVESPAHLTFLRQRSCDIAQGFFMARPLGHERLVADLEQGITYGTVAPEAE